MPILDMRDKLIVGLDLPTVAEAEAMVRTLGDDVVFYKVGLQLTFAGGLDFARRLVDQGKKVFLDVKLLDIDNTVEHAVENIARLGMTFCTIHAYPKAMRAAVEAAQGSGLCLLGVTVLTSMDAADLADDSENGTFTAAQFRDLLDNGRKVAIQILEFFDRHGVTLSRGDQRRMNKHRLDLFGPLTPPQRHDRSNPGRESSPVGRSDFKSE